MSDLPIAPPVSPANRFPVVPSAAIRSLGGLIAVLLGLVAASDVVLLGVHWWGNHGFLNEVLQGSSSSYDDARWYDSIRRTLGIVELGSTLVTAVVWCVWQVKIARATPDDAIRRTPGWHAGSWFIPIGNLWMPFQNMHDLWSYWMHRSGAALLRVWWGLWLVGGFLGRVMLTKKVQYGDIESFRSFNRLAIAVCGVEIVSSVVAIVVVSRLTQAVFERKQ